MESMDNVVQWLRQTVATFRVTRCCWVAPLRPGLLVLGYLNLVTGVVLAIGTSSGGVSPLVQRAQMALMDGESYPAVCILSPVVDVAAAVIMLCGVHREDVRVLMAWSVLSVCCVVLSACVYVVLCASLPALDLVAIFFTEVYQMYVIFLVRSLIVELRLKPNYRQDVLLSKVTKMPRIIEKVDVESQVEIPESSTFESRSRESASQTEDLQPLASTDTQQVQVLAETEPSPVEVASVPPASAPAPVLTGTANITRIEAPDPAPAVEQNTRERDGDIGSDDVSSKTRRKQCRVM